jgi:hypothetical protein
MNPRNFLKLLELPSAVGLLALSAAATLVTLGCGGGGGRSAPNDPGDVFITLEKSTIDVGNFSQLYLEANNINENGVLLKLRYPTSLTYSKRSAVLFPGEDKEEYIFPYTEESTDSERYLVFFFTPSKRIGDDIRMALNLKAIKKDDDAFVEIGLSNNDPNVFDSQEFKINRPFFSPLDREDIYIRGLASEASKTPSSSATASATAAATATAAK